MSLLSSLRVLFLLMLFVRRVVGVEGVVPEEEVTPVILRAVQQPKPQQTSYNTQTHSAQSAQLLQYTQAMEFPPPLPLCVLRVALLTEDLGAGFVPSGGLSEVDAEVGATAVFVAVMAVMGAMAVAVVG